MSEVDFKEYTYDDLVDYAKDWAKENDFTADMMLGIIHMGINTYENSYSGYSLAMQAYSNSENVKKEGK